MAFDFQVLQFKPGVSRESTKYTNEGTYYECDKVRFRSGYPEKIGGWEIFSKGVMIGICRSICEWVTLNEQHLFGLGTNLKYYVYFGELFWDITPIRAVKTLVNNPMYTMFSNLTANITDTDTVLPITSVIAGNMNLIVPFVVQIGLEKIYVPVVDPILNTLGTPSNPCVRAFEGTIFSPHSAGDAVSSSWVVIASPASGATSGDFVTVQGATPIPGYGPPSPPAINLLNSNVMVSAVSGAYIACDYLTQSTSAANGGGNAPVTLYYEINSGLAYPGLGIGWGAGPWSRNGWGTPVNPLQGGILINMRLWSASNFGQNLVYNPRYGAIYYWDASTDITPGGGVTARGVDINTLVGADGYAPEKSTMVLVTDERHIMSFGCNDTGTGAFPDQTTPLDTMFIAWSDQNNQLVWKPEVQNLAGNYRLTYGSQIITACITRQETLIWTDTALYSMRYLGAPYVYGFFPLNTNITIISPNAWATANGVTYWMGHKKFYAYNGAVATLPCTLRQYVFDDINQTQWEQVYCGTNEEYNEVWWYYCSKDSPTIDRYVIYNHLENLWYYGTLNRTAWFDSHITGQPIATTDLTVNTLSGAAPDARTNKFVTQANVYQPSSIAPTAPQIVPITEPLQILVEHEIGVDDGSYNPPRPISSYLSTGMFDIGGGGYHFAFVNRLIPDVDFIGSTVDDPQVNMTIQAQNFPGIGFSTDPMQNSNTVVDGKKQTVQVYDYTHQSWIRLRGRQISFSIGSDTLGVKWQLGSPRLQVIPDGRRG